MKTRSNRQRSSTAQDGDGGCGAKMSESEVELVLHAEATVVENEVVAVEWARLARGTMNTKETGDTEVRREQIVEETDPLERLA